MKSARRQRVDARSMVWLSKNHPRSVTDPQMYTIINFQIKIRIVNRVMYFMVFGEKFTLAQQIKTPSQGGGNRVLVPQYLKVY